MLDFVQREIRPSDAKCNASESSCQYEGVDCKWEVAKVIRRGDFTFPANKERRND